MQFLVKGTVVKSDPSTNLFTADKQQLKKNPNAARMLRVEFADLNQMTTMLNILVNSNIEPFNAKHFSVQLVLTDPPFYHGETKYVFWRDDAQFEGLKEVDDRPITDFIDLLHSDRSGIEATQPPVKIFDASFLFSNAEATSIFLMYASSITTSWHASFA